MRVRVGKPQPSERGAVWREMALVTQRRTVRSAELLHCLVSRPRQLESEVHATAPASGEGGGWREGRGVHASRAPPPLVLAPSADLGRAIPHPTAQVRDARVIVERDNGGGRHVLPHPPRVGVWWSEPTRDETGSGRGVHASNAPPPLLLATRADLGRTSKLGTALVRDAQCPGSPL